VDLKEYHELYCEDTKEKAISHWEHGLLVKLKQHHGLYDVDMTETALSRW